MKTEHLQGFRCRGRCHGWNYQQGVKFCLATLCTVPQIGGSCSLELQSGQLHCPPVGEVHPNQCHTLVHSPVGQHDCSNSTIIWELRLACQEWTVETRQQLATSVMSSLSLLAARPLTHNWIGVKFSFVDKGWLFQMLQSTINPLFKYIV